MENFKKVNHTNQATSFVALLKNCLFYTLLFFTLAAFVMLVLSFIFFKLENPNKWANLIGKISLYLPALLCGLINSRKSRQSYFLGNFLLGLTFTIIVFFISILYPENTAQPIVWYLLIPLITVLGGLLGIKRQTKARKRKRHR